MFATIRAGVPATNKAVYHRIGFTAHDPAVVIELPRGDRLLTLLIVRDVELERAKRLARADRVYAPRDFAPPDGLSGDREIATAQAAVECLRRHGVFKLNGDRSLPLLYVELAREAGIDIALDVDLGVRERRQKDDAEIEMLRGAQRDTEAVVAEACAIVARAVADERGVLHAPGDSRPLTADRLRRIIDAAIVARGYAAADTIVAGGPVGSDCHHPGEGELRTGEPVMIDVFPQNKSTLYHGDCTRTVVHGQVPETVARMHAIVGEAKRAAAAVARVGVTGDAVHAAVVAVYRAHGVHVGFAPDGAPADLLFCPHGTGHGLGLDLKEPPLLDAKGPALLPGDVVTIEPAVYCRSVGGVRVEDLYVVREGGCENLNTLAEGLQW
ncbi:MAG TPA: M24 family metallopeptidase [Tepidisphaeraceae bacterium]